ncbi:GhoT/OrtT family toxin [Enterobacteriaceae bacterium LUAb1]
MTLYQHLLLFYGVVGAIAMIVTFFLAKESTGIRILSAILVGATWPMSFPLVLLVVLL